jgi:hypothetical protein
LGSWVQIYVAPSGYGRETGLEEREKRDETSWEVGLGWGGWGGGGGGLTDVSTSFRWTATTGDSRQFCIF